MDAKKLFIFFLILVSGELYGQKTDSGINKVFESDTIFWYGLDFSNFKLTNPAKLNQTSVIKYKYIKDWINYFEVKLLNTYDPNNRSFIQKKLKSFDLVENTDLIQDKYIDIDQKSLVSHMSNVLTESQIKVLLKNYELNRSEGVGMLIIVENFNKLTELVSVYVTFFEIESRELLSIKRVIHTASGSGMTGHWGKGLVNCTKKYFNEFYIPISRKYKKGVN